MAVPAETYIKVTMHDDEYVATDHHGNVITSEVPFRNLDHIYGSDDQVGRWTGKQWRVMSQKDYDAAAKKSSKVKALPTAVDVLNGEDEDSMDREKVIEFINESPSLIPKSLKIEPLHWKYAVRTVLRGENLLIEGETGVGKTLTVLTLATALNRKLFIFQMAGSQDPRGFLIGNTHFEVGKGTFVDRSHFIQAIETPNAIILLDELSRAHPGTNNILLQVLDRNQRFVRIDEEVGSPIVRVAKGVSFIATNNSGSTYTGTRTLDRALLDRFYKLVLPALKKDEEIELLTELYPDLEVDVVNAVADIADSTRKDVRSTTPTLTTSISTRSTVDMCGLIHDGFTLEEALEVGAFALYPDQGGSKSQRMFVRQLAQKWLVNAKNITQTKNPNAALKPWQG